MKRKMCPGIEGVEGSNHGHDAVATAKAIPHLEKRGRTEAAEYLKGLKKTSDPYPEYKASGKVGSNRQTAGQTITECIGSIPADERKGKVLVIDSDLGGSTAMTKVQDAYPEVYIQSGIMERGNLSAAGGFGSEEGKQGITSTFAAFLEMCISEITMARLNKADILCHFSHSGVDDMADNTCHFGINNMFADNGLEDGYETMLYFPADFYQVLFIRYACVLSLPSLLRVYQGCRVCENDLLHEWPAVCLYITFKVSSVAWGRRKSVLRPWLQVRAGKR